MASNLYSLIDLENDPTILYGLDESDMAVFQARETAAHEYTVERMSAMIEHRFSAPLFVLHEKALAQADINSKEPLVSLKKNKKDNKKKNGTVQDRTTASGIEVLEQAVDKAIEPSVDKAVEPSVEKPFDTKEKKMAVKTPLASKEVNTMNTAFEGAMKAAGNEKVDGVGAKEVKKIVRFGEIGATKNAGGQIKTKNENANKENVKKA